MTCMKYMPKHFWREYLCVLQGFLHVLISRPVRAHSLGETHSQLFQLCSILQSCHSILEPCAEVIVSACQSILVSGGMMPVPKNQLHDPTAAEVFSDIGLRAPLFPEDRIKFKTTL